MSLCHSDRSRAAAALSGSCQVDSFQIVFVEEELDTS